MSQYAKPDIDGWSGDFEDPVRCLHCAVEVVRNYDGLNTGWSHLYGTNRDGTKACFECAQLVPYFDQHDQGTYCNNCGTSAYAHA